MSAIRPHTCAAPGPRDLHCQDRPGHRYTCQDGEECWAEWHFEAFDLAPHKCTDPTCETNLSTAQAPCENEHQGAVDE